MLANLCFLRRTPCLLEEGGEATELPIKHLILDELSFLFVALMSYYISMFLHRLWRQLTGCLMQFVKHQPGGLLEVRYMMCISVELVHMNPQAIQLCCTVIHPGRLCRSCNPVVLLANCLASL